MIVFGLLARKKMATKVAFCRLVVERAKFAKHAVISAAVCYGGKGRLLFIPDKAKVNSKLCRESLLPKLIEYCNTHLLSGFIFQQDRAPSHTAKLAQNWIAANCSDLSEKTNVSEAMHERYKTFQTKPNTIDELKKVLQSMWDDLPQNSSQQGHMY